MSKLQINQGRVKYYKYLTRLSSIVLFIFAYAIVITGSTYAFMSISDMNNEVANGDGGCFEVSYTGQTLNAGTIISTTNYQESAHTTVTLSKDSSCKIYTEANIYLHTNNTTTAPVDTIHAMKYIILNGTTQISEGLITSKGDFIIATVPLTDTQKTYTIYLWIDSNLSGGAYHDTSYSGYIYAESAQTSTIENQYLVTFNTNGGNKISPQIVTYNEEYENLPTPTREGYTFAGWSLVPEEYQQVEYIKSDGNSYIDTGITLQNEFKINLSFISNQVTSGEQPIISTWSSNFNYWNLFVTSSGALDLYVKAHKYANTGALTLGETNIVVIQRDGNNFSLKQNSSTTSFSNSTLTENTNTVKIFKRGDLKNNSYVSISNVQIKKSNNLVMNLIPCYKKTDVANPGLCDTVTGHFYENDGTGTFTKGNNYPYITNSSTVTQEHNHTLYAIWTPKTYTVTLNPNGGSVTPTTQQVTMGQSYGTLPNPTRSGYTFKGWNGKNLFNKNSVPETTGKYIKGDGTTSNYAAYSIYKVGLKPNTTYTIRNSGKSSSPGYAIFNSSGTRISGENYNTRANITFTTPSTASYIKLSVVTDSTGTDAYRYDKDYFQLEEGENVTSYEPYILSSTTPVTQAKNHTLTAIWEQN